MILLIDNYDSFTFNLVHRIGETMLSVWEERGERGRAPDIRVERNDALTAAEAIGLKPDAIVLSPGPCTPKEAGVCVELVGAAADAGVPLFGVCLGHQAIGAAFGGEIAQVAPVHGKTSPILHQNQSVFRGLPSPLTATRYHSLVVDRAGWPDELEATAETEDGLAMGLRHRTLPIHGVQFHPESIASADGHAMIRTFLIEAEAV